MVSARQPTKCINSPSPVHFCTDTLSTDLSVACMDEINLQYNTLRMSAEATKAPRMNSPPNSCSLQVQCTWYLVPGSWYPVTAPLLHVPCTSVAVPGQIGGAHGEAGVEACLARRDTKLCAKDSVEDLRTVVFHQVPPLSLFACVARRNRNYRQLYQFWISCVRSTVQVAGHLERRIS